MAAILYILLCRMKESDLELLIRAEILRRGGWSEKFIGKSRGIPDRVACVPGFGTFFVEAKSSTGRLSMAQHETIGRMRRAGAIVLVERSLKDFTYDLESLRQTYF